MSSAELGRLARVWSRGNRAFKRAFDTIPADPATKQIEIKLKPDFLNDQSPEAMKLKQYIEDCDAVSLVSTTQQFATERTARFARFQVILCLGEKVYEEDYPEEKV